MDGSGSGSTPTDSETLLLVNISKKNEKCTKHTQVYYFFVHTLGENYFGGLTLMLMNKNLNESLQGVVNLAKLIVFELFIYRKCRSPHLKIGPMI